MKYLSCLLTLSLAVATIVSAEDKTSELNRIPPEQMEQITKGLPGTPLTDDQVQSAILLAKSQGKKPRPDAFGLNLSDSGQAFLNAMNGHKAESHSGFGVKLFTPTAWIAYQAADAGRQYKNYEAQDATEQDRLPLLRVIVTPDTPEYVSAGAGMRQSSSVDHVVLRSDDKKDAVQPVYTAPYEVEVSNAMGGRKAYNGIIALFRMDDLETLRRASEKREFLVTVIGDKKEKDFKVKQRHFENLN